MSLLFLQVGTTQRPDLVHFFEVYWPILLVTAIGMAALYLLLPRPRSYPVIIGAVVGLLALTLAGLWLIRAEPIRAETVLFYSFATIAVVSGGVMIAQTRPVHAALAFSLVILSTCGLFLLQAAPFLMASTIIVYAGAIVVTFLFVIMLAQQAGLTNADHRSREPLLACIAGFVLLAAMLCVLQRSYHTQPNQEAVQKIDDYRKKIEAAANANNYADLRKAIGNDEAVLKELKEFEKYVRSLGEDENPQSNKFKLVNLLIKLEVTDLEDPKGDDSEQKFEELRLFFAEMNGRLWQLRNELHGIVQPDAALPLSRFSGTPPNQFPPRDPQGRPHMPADNVAALGQSLFTDNLLAVELVAMLLLVATIGAIAIAGRRTEGLK